ncbi:MAG: hypothetical protein US83_C0002G0113 [Candidatus Falkowbacteria bacterium GW2011_GWC2_38_22]|uniref:Cohesin domain-containing protein n=1 Tax=Candidatus Falkowbacteria bacterium GW2011_GWE1_38_31 TaxID=1618638 RepID=A0A0G0MAA5_9BACT|nr:MAG: hypothetical protein US73_C0007G0113 [Candidatus Falkowbacteria bacterium GW2011_GWF2_38_1205]KKQ62024.1 MAG: hypothetical protein US83_C0002G0113 [Candidatus Falkowbacteria bacterium GW2011_GWC2_38_22]KKQ63814.1 MAG: hypothetical protein US84_C0003G0004 [Candidatus Falkowbacteria bacterium GW2011_GWF1_38_22]KKQ66071.1 MAG: hypothetical protein US87_C0003G0004 [Candidatus Falkowbacteria bacterium GW2011_GWE2_38_254]KKQ70674.1 MAG: hypothetical protein US91_C0003G0004 [Candidatus Falkowb
MKKYNLIFLSLFSVCLLTGFFVSRPAEAAGASLYLSPSSGTYVIGGSFTISVKVNSGGEGINAAEGSISYDKDLLDATGVSSAGSIFPFWTTQPVISGGSVRFGGGLPPPAYTGSSGHIVKITFKAKKAGQAAVRFTSGAVLANDGKGTNILASMGSANYTVSPKVDAPKQDPTDKKPGVDTPKDDVKIEADYNKPEIKSITHPDQNIWYKANKAKFEWNMPAGVSGVSIAFNQEAASDPGSESDGLFSEKEFPEIKDGVWYLHLKFKDSKKWGTIARYKIMVDTEAPREFSIELVPAEIGEWPILRFETSDEKSGMDHYEIIQDDLNNKPEQLTVDKKEYQVSGLGAGEHNVIVKAVDKVGNERISLVNFTIEPIAAPIIVNYAADIRPSDSFFINGTAVSDGEVTIHFQKTDGSIVREQTTSDANGNWFYVSPEKYADGRYIVWTSAKNKNGIESLPSEKVSFVVSPPIFAVIGSFVINYFTVFASLIFIIFLIIALVIYIMGFVRRRLRKETIEIEKVLHENLQGFQADFENEFARLGKFEGKVAYKTEKAKSQEVLAKKIETVEKKILKEIRDVENIIK